MRSENASRNVVAKARTWSRPRQGACSEYEKLIANYAFRHHVKPGLTGWAQVNGCRGETRQIAQMQQRVKYDLLYINHWSILLDLRILLRTIVVTMRQDAAY